MRIIHGLRPFGGGEASYDPPTNEKCVFYFDDEIVDQLAESLSGSGTVIEDEDSTDDSDDTVLQGSLDLEAMGLTKEDLRRLLLASYVTQATVDTELGIEITEEELQEILNVAELTQLYIEKQTTPDEAGYYYVLFEDEDTGERKFFTATRGSIRVENENGDPMICVNNATFDYYLDWFNGNANKEVAANTTKKMYTVKEIGKIEMITYTRTDQTYQFSTFTEEYVDDTEIQKCMVPLELLVDFLQISASPDFLEAFEKLVINQDITLQVFSLSTVETTETQRTYPIDITVDARKTMTFQARRSSSGQAGGNGVVDTVTEYEDLIYDLNPFNLQANQSTETEAVTFDIKLVSADSWYFKADRTVTKNTITTYEYYNENGEATTFTPGDSDALADAPGYEIPGFTISGFTSMEELAAELRERTGSDWFDLSVQINEINSKLEDRSDVQDIIDYYTDNNGYAADSGSGFRDYQLIEYNPEITNITATAQNGTEKKVKTTSRDMLSTGTMEYEDNTDLFLGLWKNASGHYEEGALFDPDGEIVQYKDVYEDRVETAPVGNLFENADLMLFELLDYSENTQSITPVMKYILYRYTGNDYGITSFEQLLRLLGLTTVSTSDFNVNTNSTAGEPLKIVDTDDGISAEQHLIDGINNVSLYRSAAQNYLPYVDTLIDLQERYGVNAAWIVAQGCLETGGGTQGSGVTNNNWYGLGYDGVSSYYSYDTPEECFEDMARTVAQTGPYFRDGRETITEISYMWVRGVEYNPETDDPDWWYVSAGKETVRDILTGAGIDISSIMGGEILEVCAEVTDHYNAIGAQYSVSTSGSNALIWGNIEACWDHPYICCATYVSMVLYQSGLLTADQINAFNYHYTGAGGVPDMLEAAGWYRVSASEAQPGDVLNRDGYHVMIYAGNGQVWDQNTCTGAHYDGPFTTDISGYDVWRAP